MNCRFLFRSIHYALLAALLPVFVSGCATYQTTQAGSVGVERKQMMLVSSGELNNAAVKAYSDILQEAKKKNTLNRDAQQVARVRGVAGRLIAATPVFRPDAAKWEWEVNVLTQKDTNAWCMPGGKIAVYTGIIENLQLTDDELAAVMGHEISHALREHGREQASQQMLTNAGVALAGALLKLKSNQMLLAQAVTDVTISLPNSREHEIEADRMGVELAARAGYDPRAAVSLWQKMGQANQSASPQFLSTHPSSQTRIADLQVYSERVMPLYQEYRNKAKEANKETK